MAREGMESLIDVMRGLADAGTADWTNGGIVYWDNNQIQNVLDRHVTEFYREEAISVETYDGAGSAVYKTYWLPYQNIESGTAFKLEDSTGATVGTALYSVDYSIGKITFTNDTKGTAYYASGRYYDMNATAADMWRIKAANASKQVNFSTDNHRIERGQYVKNCLEMAAYYTNLAGVQCGSMERGDM